MQIHYRKLKNTEKQRTTVTLIPLHNNHTNKQKSAALLQTGGTWHYENK